MWRYLVRLSILALLETICLVLAQLSIASAQQSVPPAPEPIQYRLRDCHLHLLDFRQRTDGIRAVVAAMDRSGVDSAVISGMPVVKMWSQNERRQPQYYLEDDAPCYWYSATDMLVAREVLSLPLEQQARFHPTICGINSSDRNAVDHVQRMIDSYPGFWRGIGEVMARHDDLSALTYGEPPRANNFALNRVFKFAGQHDLPVWIHTNISSVWLKEPIYLLELELAVRAHRQTRFIWCHAGISRRIEVPTLTRQVAEMLGKYPNLFVDVSWVVYETNLLKQGQPNPDWVALIEAFPDRFMIGSDKVGRFDDYHLEMQKYYKFLGALRPATVKRISGDNMLSVLPMAGARLTPEETAALHSRQPADANVDEEKQPVGPTK
jgi:hypothetical protein